MVNNSSNVIPVFSAKGCTNPKASKNESFAYSITDFETKTEHGDFDLSTGIFTVKTNGLYHLQFTAHIETNKRVNYHRYDLRVDGIYKAVSFTQTSSENEQHQAIIISAYLPLKSGEKVGVFRVEGGLYEDIYHVSRFVGIILTSI